MPESLQPAQIELADRARHFAEDRLPALRARHPDDAEALRAAVIRASREAGFFGMTQPASHGGSEASALELTLVREALAASGDPARHHVFGPGPGVLAGAGGELASDFLEPLLRGEKRSGFAFTEPAGAEPTRALEVDGDWRVSGEKSWVTGGAGADFFAVVARLEAGACGACHIKLSAVEHDRIQHLPDDEEVRCEECGRVLVRV